MPTRATTASAPPLLHVRVQPRARRSEVVGWHGDALRVRVTAPPADGAANRAVTDLLAGALGIPASRIALVRGATSRDKLFRVERLSPSDVRTRLSLPRPPGERGRTSVSLSRTGVRGPPEAPSFPTIPSLLTRFLGQFDRCFVIEENRLVIVVSRW